MRVCDEPVNSFDVTGYFQQVRHVDWIEPADLQSITDDFVRYVEDYTKLHNIFILYGRVGERHVDHVVDYLNQVSDQNRVVYCIIKIQEETFSLVSYVSASGTDKERTIFHGRQGINLYYFCIKDPELSGGNSIRISSCAPSPVTVRFNGYHFITRQIYKRSVSYQMWDNLFITVDDQKRFRRAIAALTPRAIEWFCNS